MVVLYWFWGNSCLVLQSPKKTSSLLVWYPPRIHTFKPPSAKAVIKLDRALHISSSWQVVWKISSLLGCFLILERVCIASYVEQVWLSSFYDLLGISSYCVSSTVTTSNITQFGDYLQRFHLIPSYTAKHPQHNRLRTGSLGLHPVPRQTSLYIFQGRWPFYICASCWYSRIFGRSIVPYSPQALVRTFPTLSAQKTQLHLHGGAPIACWNR